MNIFRKDETKEDINRWTESCREQWETTVDAVECETKQNTQYLNILSTIVKGKNENHPTRGH